jgi:OFA family oxalate/formate antiporter-like MFS transporter
MSDQKRSSIFYGWKITFISLAVTTTAFGVLYSFGVFFKLWLEEWACNRAFLSGVFSLSFLMYGIASFFMGRLTDRYGPRKTLALGGLIMGAGALATAWLNHAGALYLTFGLMIGIGVGTSYSPTASTVSRWFIAKKGLAVGTVVAGLGLGTLIYSPLAKLFIGLWNWRVAFIVLGILIWAVYFTAAYIIRRDPKDLGLQPYGAASAMHTNKMHPKESKESPPGPAISLDIGVRDALKMSRFWLLFTIHLLWVLGMATPMVHLVPYATDIGVSPGRATLMLAVIGGISVLGRVALGAVGEKLGLKKSLALLLIIQALTMFWLAFSKETWMVWIFSFLFGFSYGGLASIFPLVTVEYFGLFAMGAIFGLILLGATIGGVIGPWLAGFIFDLTSRYFWGFIAGGLSMLLGLVLVIMLRPGSLSESESY